MHHCSLIDEAVQALSYFGEHTNIIIGLHALGSFWASFQVLYKYF